MGKAAKKRRSEKKKAEKKRLKAARKALYASYARQGKSRSKRGKKKDQKTRLKADRHTIQWCGNVGCLRCNPIPENLTRGRRVAVMNGVMTLAEAIRETDESRGISWRQSDLVTKRFKRKAAA